MAQQANTHATFNSKRVREELMDKIWNVSVDETPTLKLCGTKKIETPHPEWLNDSFRPGVPTNRVEQGHVIINVNPTADVERYDNRTQISIESGGVTRTQEKASKAGPESEYNYQVMVKSMALKKDIEASFIQNTTAIPAVSGTGGQARGLLGWIKTNTVKGVGGVDPNPLTNVAPTDGTPAPFTEQMLKDVLRKMHDSGCPNMDSLYMLIPSAQRGTFDTFLANQTRFDKAEDKVLTATLEVYIGPFGRVKAVNTRHMRTRDIFILNREYVKKGIFDPMRDKEIDDRRADAREFKIVAEWTVWVANERALGAIRDLSGA